MKSLDSFRNIMRGSGLVLSVVGLMLFLSPVTSRAVLPSFFQGFEVNTSNWFDFVLANVFRVQQPNQSVTYNSGTTSVYGVDPISAASGSWFGRVKSAVSLPGTGNPAVGSCTIDVGQFGGSGQMPGIGPSLICQGPYTDFGLNFNAADSFPTDGYTIQLDIYLDVDYATHHPDCVRGPCTPDTTTPVTIASNVSPFTDLGDMNPACAEDPNGIDCEGSRFDWTVALNNPAGTGEIGPEFVFSVGTAPDPSGQINCDKGWIITAGYNSYRSGGDTYNLGFGPKCLPFGPNGPTSGWYTFQQVFSNDGGFLKVVFSILDPISGDVVQCTDADGVLRDGCTWTKHPGNAITGVGCPRFGWLANEEINDLPLDNTKLFIAGCGLSPLPRPGQITPTSTTCQQFTGGTAATLDQLLYTVKSGNINSVSPGVFFYYAYVTGSQGDMVTITETNNGTTSSPIQVQKSQVVLYSSTCTKLATFSGDPNGDVTFNLPSSSDDLFIIGVKYDSSSLKGTPKPDPTTIIYSFSATGNPASTITLQPK